MSNNQLLDALTREGVLASASVRFPRFTKRLQPEDLGLEHNEASQKLLSLGHKKLLPAEALAELRLIESRVHALVEGASFPFLGGIARFVPNAKLEEIHTGLEALRRDFERAVRTFIDEYETHRVEALQTWEEAAGELPGDPVLLMATIRGAFPEAEHLAGRFRFDVQYFQVRAPERVSAQLVRFADQQALVQARNSAAREANVRIREGVESFVRDAVATLREQTATLCTEMLSSMQQGKSGVHQKTLNRLVGFIDEFKKLNFAGDAQMESLLENARNELLSRTADEYREDAVARARLQAGIRQLADTARSLSQEDTSELVDRFGQLGVRKFQLAA